MKQLFWTLICIFSIGNVSAEKHKYIKGYFETSSCSMRDFDQQGLDVEAITKYKKGYIAELIDNEWEYVQANSTYHEIWNYDMEKFYADRLSKSKMNPLQSSAAAYITDDFNYGSMGGYLTLEEYIAEIDSMIMEYPTLITSKQIIGYSIENRPIYAVKISDNPSDDEAEPEVLYTALHHSREPMSLSQLIYFMQYILANYTTNSDIQCLINERELWFVPMINPDGYAYNQLTNPSGGGMWRKNRRDNGDGTYGIDINRNYGYEWARDDNGSSPFTMSETYRGSAAFSEPETQAIRDFCNVHQFVNALNYHTYSNVLIYPWGFDYSIFTPDNSTFQNLAALYTEQNFYTTGTADEVIGYIVNGSSDDWMYGEQSTKNKMYAMTPEIGNQFDGFWPDPSMILPSCDANIWTNLAHAWTAKSYIRNNTTDINYSGTQLQHHYTLSLENKGLEPTTVTIHSDCGSPYFIPRTDTAVTIAAQDTLDFPMFLQISPSTPHGDPFFIILIYTYDCFSDTLTVQYDYQGYPVSGIEELQSLPCLYSQPSATFYFPEVAEPIHCQIYDAQGKLCLDTEVTDSALPLHLQTSGIYFLRMTYGKSQSYTHKFLYSK